MAQRRYAAFVSYSHADREIGARLFQLLDKYRTPKRFVDTAGQFGAVPAKLYPCFRDREELTVSRDLRTGLDAALEASEHLVVVCSPAAAKSDWVSHEVRAFAVLKGVDRVHAVIVDGDYGSAFPPALAEVGLESPLAADLRREKDGWTDGSLKLIAAILGVPFGELRDRELARRAARFRRLTAASAVFSVTFLGGCSAGWVALDRDERVQRAFIGTMRDVSGRLERALHGQGASLTTREVAQELVFVRGLTRTAFALTPDSPLLLQEEMRQNIIYARYYMAQNNLSEARIAVAQVEEKFDKLDRRRAVTNEARLYRGIGRRVLGSIEFANGRESEAIRVLERSIRTLEPLRSDDGRRELAEAYTDLGGVYERQDRLWQAALAYDNAMSVRSRIAHASRQVRTDQLVALVRIGDLAFARGDLLSAQMTYDRANIRARELDSSGTLPRTNACASAELASCEPSDIRVRRTLYVTHDRLGLIALRRHDLEGAERHFATLANLVEGLAAYDRDNLILARDFALAQLQAARVVALQGRRAEARQRVDAGLEALAALEREWETGRRLRALRVNGVNWQISADIVRLTVVRALLDGGQQWNAEEIVNLSGPALLAHADELGIRIEYNVRLAIASQRDRIWLPPTQNRIRQPRRFRLDGPD